MGQVNRRRLFPDAARALRRCRSSPQHIRASTNKPLRLIDSPSRRHWGEPGSTTIVICYIRVGIERQSMNATNAAILVEHASNCLIVSSNLRDLLLQIRRRPWALPSQS